jgi:hypothetical protein
MTTDMTADANTTFDSPVGPRRAGEARIARMTGMTGMTGKGFRALVGVQAKLLFREPAAEVWLVLPTALVVLFGNIPAFRTVQSNLGGRSVIDVYVPTLAAMVPLMLAQFVASNQPLPMHGGGATVPLPWRRRIGAAC